MSDSGESALSEVRGVLERAGLHDLDPIGGAQALGVDRGALDQRAAERGASGWTGSYFGGVAFKYQRTPTDLEQTCRAATRFVDVVCTSGPGTGAAADVDKIAQIRDVIGDHPLAIASGITPSNVVDYLDLVDVFMVATGISRSFDQLDAALTSELVRHVQDYREGQSSANNESSA